MSDTNQISKKGLKQINSFINRLATSIGGSPEEINEFKEEMRDNLTLSVIDIMGEGRKEDDAIIEAFERFGDPKLLKHDIKKLYNFKSIFKTKLLYTTITIGILAALFFASFYAFNFVVMPDLASNVVTEVNDAINESSVTDKSVKQLSTDLIKNKQIYSITISSINEHNGYTGTLVRASEDNSVESIKDYGRESYFVFKENYNSRSITEDKGYVIDVSYRTLEYHYLALGQALLIIYVTMFTIWSAMQLYFNDSSNWWLLLIIPLNILGYIIYSIYKRKKSTN